MDERDEIRWFHEMSALSRASFYSNLTVFPGAIIICVYTITGIELNIFWTYVILDIITFCFIRRLERKRIIQDRVDEENESTGLTVKRIRKSLEEWKQEELGKEMQAEAERQRLLEETEQKKQ